MHFKENKKLYIGIAVGICLGTGASVMIFHSSALVNIKPVQILTWKSKQTIEVFIEALGDPETSFKTRRRVRSMQVKVKRRAPLV